MISSFSQKNKKQKKNSLLSMSVFRALPSVYTSRSWRTITSSAELIIVIKNWPTALANYPTMDMQMS